MTNNITGSCHCKNITYDASLSYAFEDYVLRKCGCSYCSKNGVIFLTDPSAKLNINIDNKNLLSRYQFDHKTADIYICSHCGITPFALSKIDEQVFGVINANTVDSFNFSKNKISGFDFSGEEVDSRLQRRKKYWISNIKIN